MAGSAGSLVVSLGLEAAEFTSGLTKAEYQAKKFADETTRSMNSANTAIAQVGKTLAGLGIGAALVSAVKDIVNGASALQDFSAQTGSSVESLSKLSNQAHIAGTEFATLQSLVLKMAAGMAGMDDESTKAAKALAFLGITTKDPAQALQEVAVKLAGYADGVGKAAIAVALFGKQGPQFLSVLKDMADLQDVAATVTAKQAAEAQALEQAYRRIGVESTNFKNAILSDVVPALLTAIEDMREGTKIAGGFFNALILFSGLNPFNTPAEGIRKLRAELEQLNADKSQDSGFSKFVNDLFGKSFDPAIDAATKKIEFLKFKQRQAALSLIDPSNNDVRDVLAQRKPTLNFSLAKESGSKRDHDDPTRKLFEGQLKEQEDYIRSEQDLLNSRHQFLSAYYQDDQLGLRDYFAGRQAALAEAVSKQAAAYDQEISLAVDFGTRKGATLRDEADAQNKINDAIAKQAKLQQDTAQTSALLVLEEGRAYRQLEESVKQAGIALQAMKGDTVGAGLAGFDLANSRRRDQLAELSKSSKPADQQLAGVGQKTLDDTRELLSIQLQLTKETQNYNLIIGELGIAQTRLDIAESTGALTTLGALREKSALAAAYVPLLQSQIAALEAINNKTPQQIQDIEKLKVAMEQLAATGDLVAKKFNDIGSGAFATFLTDISTGAKSIKAAFLDMTKSIQASISKIAADEISQTLFKKGGSLSGFGDFFSKLFGGKDSGGAAASAESAAKLLGGGAKTVTDAAGTATLTASATSLTASGAELTIAGTTLAAGGTQLVAAGGLLTGAGAALSTAAAALTAASATSAASGAGGALSSIFGQAGAFGGGGGGLAYAANGSDFTRGGLTMVGERGPEILNLPRGAQVIPNDVLRVLGDQKRQVVDTLAQNTNVLPGANFQKSGEAAKMVANKATSLTASGATLTPQRAAAAAAMGIKIGGNFRQLIDDRGVKQARLHTTFVYDNRAKIEQQAASMAGNHKEDAKLKNIRSGAAMLGETLPMLLAPMLATGGVAGAAMSAALPGIKYGMPEEKSIRGGVGMVGGGAFGGGGLAYAASGTDFARGGPTMVGERGPEIINLPRGAQVIPINRGDSMAGVNVVINQHFAPGTDHRAIRQAAVTAGDHVSRAVRRR